MNPEQHPSPWYCEHKSTEVRRRTYANGTKVACRQCLICGNSQGCVPKNKVILYSLPEWDETISERWRERAQTRYDSQRESERREFFDWYNQYLLTPEWQSLRRRVLLRSGGLCEGCRLRPAVQVHHLTYERVGKEMLFDLAAVCLECHEKIHETKDASRPEHAREQ